MADRTEDQIQRDIEQARASLAVAVDQIAYRTNPKRVIETTRRSLVEKVKSPQGRVVVAAVGAAVLFTAIRRFRKHR